jgi:ABC-type Mn2+/Zn2+ transport system ATPase subunit
MGHVDVSGINYTLSDGRVLLSDITFRVGDGAKAALVGPNGWRYNSGVWNYLA